MASVCAAERARVTAVVVVLLAAVMAAGALAQGPRVVDLVKVGDRASEREHEYAGDGVADGIIDGKLYRQTRGSLSYALNVFDDSEVVIRCTFRGTEGRTLTFDLLVEGRNVGSRAFATPSAAPTSVEFRVPAGITRNLTRIYVTLRAVDGLTPGLMEMRTIQEHLERDPGDAPRPARAPF
jgi:hypothetical protein